MEIVRLSFFLIMVVCIAIVQYYLEKGDMSMDIELICGIF